MFECKGCGVVAQGRALRVYCSNKCQRAHERQLNIARWLETGEAWPGSGVDHYVRAHIAAEQKGRCAICAVTAVWNGMELRFVLDHINGNSSDNRRENLRLICPNCDSQLPTFKNRNNGQGRYARRQRYAEGKSY